MPSENEPEPTEWGTSLGRFGSDASKDTAGSGSSFGGDSSGTGGGGTGGKKRGKRAGSSFGSSSSGPSSFGSSSFNGARKTRTGGGRSRRQSSFDDPYGPVVGSAADGDDSDSYDSYDSSRTPALPWAAGTEMSPGPDEDARPRDNQRNRMRSEARRGERGVAGHATSGSDEGREKTDDEWASEGRAIMLRQLALGPRSRHQLGVKLADRDVPATVAGALLDRFEEVQLIDDAEFARMWVWTRTAARALARSSIRRELAEKGVDPELAEEALLQVSDEDEHDQAQDIVRRKLRGNVDLSERSVRDKEVRRLVGVLARKGYSPGAAFTIVKNVIAAATDEATSG